MDTLEDLDLLTRDELIDLLRERAEAGVKLTFPGKALTRRVARKVRPRVARRVAKYSAGTQEEQAQNYLYEGDNLQAMATLYRERGAVDLVLTDPPYNTGGDWRYNDRWDEDPNDPGIGDIVDADDRARHTKWMKFMWPRLLLMKSMLKPSGILAICIDHRELFHLGQMLDEMFGEQNRLAIINWQKTYSPKNDQSHVSTATEYVLVYAKDMSRAETSLLPRSEMTNARYTNPDNDPGGRWQSSDATAMGAGTHPGQVYGIQNPFTGEIQYPPEGRHWIAERAKMRRWLDGWGSEYEDMSLPDDMPSPALVLKGAIFPGTGMDPVVQSSRAKAEVIRDSKVWPELWFCDQGEGRPRRKRYLERVRKGIVPTTYWADDDFDTYAPDVFESISWDHEESGHSQSGLRELTAVVGPGHGFETVKPLKLFQKIIQIWCPGDGLVLDPFAGSGTTGHAILALNREAGSSRRFILIEQGRPDKGDSYARTLTANRLQRVINGNWANGKGSPLNGGFEFRTLKTKVDAAAVLAMERDELVDTVIASYFDSSRRKGPGLIRLPDHHKYRYLVARNTDDEGFYLVWDGPDQNTNFTEEVYESCVEEGHRAGLKAHYHVYSRFNFFVTPGVTWYQIPDRILADFGLDVRTEAYTDDEEA